MRRDGPADPEARCERLGERPQVDHAFGVQRVQRRQRVTVEAEQPVRVVLQDQHAELLSDPDDLGASLGRHRHPGRVVMVRDGVEQLDSAAGPLEVGQRLGQRLGYETVRVHRNVDDIRLVGLEDPEGADVAGGLGHHHVARVDEDPGDQVEGLLRAGGDDDVIGMATTRFGAITSRIRSRRPGSPWPEPYCMATVPRSETSLASDRLTTSSGRACRFGIPPARETTSGRLATAKSARISEAVMPRVRAA